MAAQSFQQAHAALFGGQANQAASASPSGGVTLFQQAHQQLIQNQQAKPPQPTAPVKSSQPKQPSPQQQPSVIGKTAQFLMNTIHNLPEAHFADTINQYTPKGFAGKVTATAAGLAQGLINIPAEAFKGALSIGEHAKAGTSTPKQVVADIASAVQLPLLFLAPGEGSALAQGAKQVVKQGVKQAAGTVVKGIARESIVGGGFGLLGGLSSGKNITNANDYVKNLLENVKAGAEVGGTLGTLSHVVLPLAKGLPSKAGAVFVSVKGKLATVDHMQLDPQVAQSTVLGNDKVAKLPVGKAILKTSVEAEQAGQHVGITPSENGKYTIAGGQKVDVALVKPYEPKNQTKEGAVASSVIHLPDKNIYAKVTPEQLAYFQNETNAIKWDEGDRPHLSPFEKVQDSGREISLQEMRDLSPNVNKAFQGFNSENRAIKIPEDLRPEEKPSFDQLAKEPSQMVKDYMARFGNVADQDNAKYLFEGYKKELAKAYHRASIIVRDRSFNKMLKENKGKGNTTIVLTAGGPGSGKSESYESDIYKDHYPAIYDTSLSNYDAAKKVLQKISAHNYDAAIRYVYADPITAWKRALVRGRFLDPRDFIEYHQRSLDTIRKLYSELKDDEKVDFHFIDNSGELGQAKEVSFDFLKDKQYTREELLPELYKLSDKAHENGKITKELYEKINDTKTEKATTQREDETVSSERAQQSKQDNGKEIQGKDRLLNKPQETQAKNTRTTTAELPKETKYFNKQGKELAPKGYKKLLKTKEVIAIRDVMESKFAHIRQTVTNPEQYGKEIDKLVGDITERSQGDKTVLSALRTEINKEMFGVAGVKDNYKEGYAQLQEIRKQDPETGALIDKLETHKEELDKTLLSTPDKSYQVPAKIKQKRTGKQAGFTGASEPVGTGKQRKSEAFNKFVDNLQEADPKRYEELKDNKITYNRLNLEKDAEAAISLVEKDPQKAYQIAKGMEAAPQGQTETAISIALADRAAKEGNYKMQADLETARSLRQTRRGQEIVSERGRFNDTSPYHFIQQLLDTRLKQAGKSIVGQIKTDITGKAISMKKAVVERIDKETQVLKEVLTKEQRKIKTFQSIMDSLVCK